ncbi:unnamed protein product [Didymodactylos carnosus]|uniref:Uncharacterized protein n=1 Tax=Didymodactylos carnosus TaxID=1234261 RepID=A0A8S2DNU7_9BILA|nr:unnamed protein product [Didymodactylos carnosus]CAF3745550.1 unnamed protein product [Didymodactylos carnosus]
MKKKKNDYWSMVGGPTGLAALVRTLNENPNVFKSDVNWRSSNSVWSRIIDTTSLQNTEEARKWIYTIIKEDRHNIKSLILPTPASISPFPSLSSNIVDSESICNEITAPPSSSSTTITTNNFLLPVISSHENPNITCIAFTMSSQDFKQFFNRTEYSLCNDWQNIVYQKLVTVSVTCVLAFQHNHVKKVLSRKRNTPFFKADAKCKIQNCPATFRLTLKDIDTKPRSFLVEISDTPKHDNKEVPARRQLTGNNRLEMG